MQSKLSSTQPGRDRRDEVVLADLEKRFVRFRAKTGRGARVPIELRSAALAALSQGVSPGELSRACAISWSQLDAWKRRARIAEVPDEVRVFSVIDDVPLVEEQPACRDGELELRLGPWSVTVRLAQKAPAPRAPCSR